MFKLAKQREVLWPVTINVPAEDGSGAVTPVQIKVRYKLLSRTEIREAIDVAKQQAEKGGEMTEEQVRADDEWLAARITGWEDVVDAETGAPVEFSAEALAALMAVPYVTPGLAKGLWDASRGAPAKNS